MQRWGIERDQLDRIPVYSKIAAGQPITMNSELDQNIYLPKEWVRGGSYFILNISGDSMTGAKIDHGDLVVIRCQQSADNLDIAVVGIGEEGTLKRFSRMGSNVILLAENPKYDPIMIDEEDYKKIKEIAEKYQIPKTQVIHNIIGSALNKEIKSIVNV
jgi:SOS-response transcriptional repressor LexA